MPCTPEGDPLAIGESPPPPEAPPSSTDWFPYEDRASFEAAEFLFRKNQMPGAQINELFQIWASHKGQDPPFADKDELYSTIDDTVVGNVEWQSFTMYYDGDDDAQEEPAPWKSRGYDVWFRDPKEILHRQLGNPDFAGEMDYTPKRLFDNNKKRYYSDFMSGNWAWRQAVRCFSFNSVFKLY